MVAIQPTDCLPDELLASIFMHYVEYNIDSLWNKASPWTVSQVCSCWRRVAFDTAAMWTYIKITPDSLEEYAPVVDWNEEDDDEDRVFMELYEKHLLGYVFRSRHYLNHSKSMPLQVQILMSHMEGDTPCYILQQLADLLALHSHRIEKLEIDIRWPTALNQAIQNSPNTWTLPSLRHLKSTIDGYDRSYPMELLRLTTALTQAKFTDYVPSATDICWSTLTNLDIDGYANDPVAVHAILPFLDNLQTLTVNSLKNDEATLRIIATLKPVILPSAERVYSKNPSLFLLVTAPKLRAFHPGTYEDDQDVEILVAFLNRSRCPLEHLYFQSSVSNVSRPALLRLLSAVPNLPLLAWRCDSLEEAFIDALSMQDDYGSFKYCPALKGLDLNLSHVHPAHVIDVVERRRGERTMAGLDEPDHGTLQIVRFTFSEEFWLGELQECQHISGRIRRLRDEGMVIVAHYVAKSSGWRTVEVWSDSPPIPAS